MQIEILSIEALTPYARNSRTHSQEHIQQVAASIREFGFTNPVLIDADGGVIAGHGRIMAAKQNGMQELPCIRLTHLTDAQKRAYVIADNQLALNAGWDEDLLALELSELKDLEIDLDLLGFNDAELEQMIAVNEATTEGQTDPNQIPELPTDPITNQGDIWKLGKHRLMCGDATVSGDVNRLLAGQSVDLICTDPPYCSGGFQESGKSSGSVGTTAAHKMIANDTLSTRGYAALLKLAFALIKAPYLYAFTDWRMWVHLFYITESSGYGVRSMIVWDKGSPGMGRGWRAQHELMLWGCKNTPPFDKHAPGIGNVIQAKRTGNIHHTTQKPVELIESLISNVPFARIVADPFNGSGTTLLACETQARNYIGMELDPAYVDVSIKRWQQFTGKTATLESTGEAFPG